MGSKERKVERSREARERRMEEEEETEERKKGQIMNTKKEEERNEGVKDVPAGSSVRESNEKQYFDLDAKLEACLQ